MQRCLICIFLHLFAVIYHSCLRMAVLVKVIPWVVHLYGTSASGLSTRTCKQTRYKLCNAYTAFISIDIAYYGMCHSKVGK